MAGQRPKIDPELTRRGRELRREMTMPERRLWYALRDHRLEGLKFRRQVVIGRYIVDFHSRAANLVIEPDGDSHADRGAFDEQRQTWLESQGLRVLRFSNDDVLKNLEDVLETILRAARK